MKNVNVRTHKVIFWIGMLIFWCCVFWMWLDTERGLRFSFVVVEKITKEKISAKKLHGTILSPLEIEGFCYCDKNNKVYVKKLYLDWAPVGFILGKINIRKLYVDDLEIQTITDKVNAQTKTNINDFANDLKQLSIPKYLILNDVKVKNILLKQDENLLVKNANAILRLSIINGNVDFLNIKVSSQEAEALVQGKLQQEWNVDWKIRSKLKLFSNTASGEVYSVGKILGSRTHPQINSVVKVDNFKQADIMFSKLEARAGIDFTRQTDSQFILDVVGPEIGEIKLNKFSLLSKVLAKKDGESSARFMTNVDALSIRFPSDVAINSQPLDLEKCEITGTINNKGLLTEGVVFIKQHAPIELNLRLPDYQNFLSLFEEKQRLFGRVSWQTENLAVLQKINAIVKNVKGKLNFYCDVSGTIKKPKASGLLTLTNGSMDIVPLNIKLANIDLKSQLKNNRLEYQASIRSSKGDLNIIGQTLLSPDVSSEVQIKGKDFLVSNNNEYMVIVSPDIKLQAKNSAIKIDGNIDIPKANIRPEHLGQNDFLPPEITYVHDADLKQSSMDLYANVKLNLGNEVLIDVKGLRGRVEGQLEITDDPNIATIAMGELNLKDASYDIYGQTLNVTKGSIKFLKSLITNPGIDIEAVRDFKITSSGLNSFGNSLIVGVRARGVLNDLNVDLFSQPAGMPKPDILSYLVFGKSSKEVSNDKLGLLWRATSALVPIKMSSGFGEKTWFSDFGFTEELRPSKQSAETQDSDEPKKQPQDNSLTTTTAFALGKFLTPKIYVGYSIGIMDSVNVFRVKYLINKYLRFQSESSILGSGADLLYVIDRN